MTREGAHDLLPIIQAFSEGKLIEYLSHGVWEAREEIGFDSEPYRYRIKPEPREWWVTLNAAGSTLNMYENEAAAIRYSCGNPPIKVREVLE